MLLLSVIYVSSLFLPLYFSIYFELFLFLVELKWQISSLKERLEHYILWRFNVYFFNGDVYDSTETWVRYMWKRNCTRPPCDLYTTSRCQGIVLSREGVIEPTGSGQHYSFSLPQKLLFFSFRPYLNSLLFTIPCRHTMIVSFCTRSVLHEIQFNHKLKNNVQ